VFYRSLNRVLEIGFFHLFAGIFPKRWSWLCQTRLDSRDCVYLCYTVDYFWRPTRGAKNSVSENSSCKGYWRSTSEDWICRREEAFLSFPIIISTCYCVYVCILMYFSGFRWIWTGSIEILAFNSVFLIF